MLARLLRYTYLVQLLTGMLLGTWAAMALAPRWGGASLVLIGLSGLGWIVMGQAVIIVYSMLKSRPSGPLWPWLIAGWSEFKAALLIFGLRQPWVWAKPEVLLPLAHPKAGTSTLPVLLVHGFISNHRVWDTVAKALQQDGHTVLTVNLEPLFTPIDDYAPLIEAAARELCNQTGSDKVVLVGHSMGGLAIRAWLRRYGAEHVAKIITLGTPNQGTQAPQWLSTSNGEQMKWRSAWVTELARDETPAKRKLMHLALTHHDNIVYPQRDQMLDGAEVTEFSGMGHLAMCLDAGVIQWLLRQVDAPVGNALSHH